MENDGEFVDVVVLYTKVDPVVRWP